MNKYNSFDAFEADVISAAQKKGFKRGAALEGFFLPGIVAGAGIRGIFGVLALNGLNEHMYKSYLKEKYRDRFEKHKNDSDYLSRLIEEASNDLNEKYSYYD